MTSWHGLSTNEAYDRIQLDARRSKPVSGPIKDSLGGEKYILRYEPMKKSAILEVPADGGGTMLFPSSIDPNSSALWVNVPAVSRGQIEGFATNYTGTYAEVAAHAKRFNDMEAGKTGGPSHIFSVDIMPKAAA